jgi:hypothetical protein
MSTNFYAEIAVNADDTTPAIKFHIGKTSSNSVSVDGNLFSSFAEMVAFLRYNESKATITDEYGSERTLDEVVERFYSFSPVDRSRQSRYMSGEDGRTVQDAEHFSISTGNWS